MWLTDKSSFNDNVFVKGHRIYKNKKLPVTFCFAEYNSLILVLKHWHSAWGTNILKTFRERERAYTTCTLEPNIKFRYVVKQCQRFISESIKRPGLYYQDIVDKS